MPTSLQQEIKRIRAEQTGGRPPCYGTKERATTLRIETSSGGDWLLPWSNFVSTHLDEEDGRDRLLLKFQEYEVMLHGQNLRALVDMIENSRLASLCPIPVQYLKAFGEEPFIKEAQVNSIAEPTTT